MSYADVAATNAPPQSLQPKPDQGLLNTESPNEHLVADESQKVNLVSPNFREQPATTTTENHNINVESDYSDDEGQGNTKGSEKRKRRRDKQLKNVEKEAEGLWAAAKEKLLQPGVAGGLLGVVNVGLLGYTSYALYTSPSLRRDTRALSFGSVSLLALFGLEGYAAERYAQTSRGKAERQRAREEGAALHRYAREAVFRPDVLGGLLGIVNVGILGGVGYFAWTNWDKPTWDRKVVSTVSVGLLGLWSAEGALAEKFRRESESSK